MSHIDKLRQCTISFIMNYFNLIFWIYFACLYEYHFTKVTVKNGSLTHTLLLEDLRGEEREGRGGEEREGRVKQRELVEEVASKLMRLVDCGYCSQNYKNTKMVK